ncbi:MAG: hypothetical protein ABWX56_08110, partial [Mycetocola sp.]
MSNETSRETDNDTGSDSTLDSTTALPTRRSLRAAARSAEPAAAAESDVAHVEQPAFEPAESSAPAEPALTVDAEESAAPQTSPVPTLPNLAAAPSRACLAARVAATPASARSVPTQSRWKSIRSLLVVSIAVPAIFGTVALPAYAVTSEDSAAVAPVYDTGAQSLTVPNLARTVLA